MDPKWAIFPQTSKHPNKLTSLAIRRNCLAIKAIEHARARQVDIRKSDINLNSLGGSYCRLDASFRCYIYGLGVGSKNPVCPTMYRAEPTPYVFGTRMLRNSY